MHVHRKGISITALLLKRTLSIYIIYLHIPIHKRRIMARKHETYCYIQKELDEKQRKKRKKNGWNVWSLSRETHTHTRVFLIFFILKIVVSCIVTKWKQRIHTIGYHNKKECIYISIEMSFSNECIYTHPFRPKRKQIFI